MVLYELGLEDPGIDRPSITHFSKMLLSIPSEEILKTHYKLILNLFCKRKGKMWIFENITTCLNFFI